MGKKYRLIMILLLMLIVTGCKQSSDPNCGEVLSSSDGTYVLNQDFCDDGANSKAQIIAKVDFYIDKIISFTGGEIEGEGSIGPRLVKLSDSGNFYTKDNFSTYYNQSHDADYVDLESMMNMNMTLEMLKDFVDRCVSFDEGVFCDVIDNNGELVKIKMQIDGDRLLIESFSYSKVGTYKRILSEMMYFDIVDEQMYFEYLRDHYSNINGVEDRNVYFDLFFEGTRSINTAVNVMDNDHVYYQENSSDSKTKIRFEYNNNESYFSYFDYENGVEYFIQNPADYDYLSVGYYDGLNRVFRISHSLINNNDVYILEYNILELDCWDKFFMVDDDVTLYNNDEIIMSELVMHGSLWIYNQYVEGRINIEPLNLTEGVISLNDYGGVFDFVTLVDINFDIERLVNGYEDTLMENIGFTNDLSVLLDEIKGIYNLAIDEEVFEQIKLLLN